MKTPVITDDMILAVCKRIVEEVDYDIFKEYEEDPDLYGPIIKILREMVDAS